MSQKPSWRHHFVPKFMLAYWVVGNDDMLSQYGRKHDGSIDSVRRAPNATGFEKHLYRLELGPNQAVDFFETGFLKKVDDEASKVIAKLHKGERPLNAAQMTVFSRFVMSLIQRDPITIQAIKQRVQGDYERLVAYGRERTAPNPAEAAAFENFLSGDGAYLIGQGCLAVMQRAMDNFQLGSRLNSMRWRIADLSDCETPLMTSDRPVIISDRGIAGSDGFVALALSPHIAVFGFADPAKSEALDRMPAERTVQYLNEHVVRQAVKFAYGVDGSAVGFVQEFFGNRPIPSVQQNLAKGLLDRARDHPRGPIEDEPRFREELQRMLEQLRNRSS